MLFFLICEVIRWRGTRGQESWKKRWLEMYGRQEKRRCASRIPKVVGSGGNRKKLRYGK